MKAMKKYLSILLSVLMLVGAFAFAVPAAEAECNHVYTYTKIDATCISGAYREYFCSLCKDKYKEDIASEPALGHEYGEWQVLDEAECMYEGHEQRDCTRCEKTDTRTTAALGHADENENGRCDRCNVEMELEETFAPFDWLIALFRAIAQFFKDIFA